MLSVLIPTYNYNAFFLVKKIHKQLILANVDFEIICFDDGSKSILNIKNKEINTLSFSKFKIVENNIGRSAIRNLLAKEAKYKWLLFLDADCLPVKQDFIKKYIACFKSENTIFCGGILYQNNNRSSHLLRYKYGKKHEEINLKKRIKKPNKYFFTSNFLLQKKVFTLVSFEEKLTEYGREDLFFSIKLLENGFNIEHLSNEVYHLGIDENALFVSKTKKAMENIVFLNKMQLINIKEFPLLNLVKRISKIKLAKIIGNYYFFFENLAIKRSSVFFLNCMKVSYLCYLKEVNEKK